MQPRRPARALESRPSGPRPLELDDCVLRFQVAIEAAYESAQVEFSNATALKHGLKDRASEGAVALGIAARIDPFGAGRALSELCEDALRVPDGGLVLDAQTPHGRAVLLYLHACLTKAQARYLVEFYGALQSAFNLDPTPFRASGWEHYGLRASALWFAILEAEPGFAARVEISDITFNDVWSECVARSKARASEASDSSNIG